MVEILVSRVYRVVYFEGDRSLVNGARDVDVTLEVTGIEATIAIDPKAASANDPVGGASALANAKDPSVGASAIDPIVASAINSDAVCSSAFARNSDSIPVAAVARNSNSTKLGGAFAVNPGRAVVHAAVGTASTVDTGELALGENSRVGLIYVCGIRYIVIVAARRSVWEEQLFNRRQNYNTQVFIDESEIGVVNPQFYRAPEIDQLIDDALAAVFEGKRAATSILAELNARVEPILAEAAK